MTRTITTALTTLLLAAAGLGTSLPAHASSHSCHRVTFAVDTANHGKGLVTVYGAYGSNTNVKRKNMSYTETQRICSTSLPHRGVGLVIQSWNSYTEKVACLIKVDGKAVAGKVKKGQAVCTTRLP